MNKIYKLINDFNEDYMLGLGYTKIPNTGVYAKIVPQEIDSKPVQALLINYYENPMWKKEIYPKIKSELKKEIGLKYDKNGEIIMTNRFKAVITSWVIQIDTNDDNWLGFTSYNNREPKVFYNSVILDEFCAKEIEDLKKLNLIELIEVNN